MNVQLNSVNDDLTLFFETDGLNESLERVSAFFVACDCHDLFADLEMRAICTFSMMVWRCSTVLTLTNC